MTYEVTLVDERVERIEGADSFAMEGPLTTFFGCEGGRCRLDAWSTKVASFRTDRILSIKRLGGAREPDHEVQTFANCV